MYEEIRREYRAPFMVPAMVEAFEKLSQLSGHVLNGVDDGVAHQGGRD